MRLVSRLSLPLIVSSLIAVTGCGASAVHSSSVADTSSDPSWTPPGEMNVTIAESAPAPKAQPRGEAVTMQPNKRVILKRQLHAATY